MVLLVCRGTGCSGSRVVAADRAGNALPTWTSTTSPGNLASATDQRDLQRACRDAQAVIESRGARSPILAEGHLGLREKPARGLSLYFFPPFRDPSVFNRELDFARRTRWTDCLETYLGDGT